MERSSQPPADDSDPAAAGPTPKRKVKVMDLARYRVGQRVYWVVFRSERSPELRRAEEWVKREHPMLLWRHKLVPWSVPMRPPRAHPGDTLMIMMLCMQQPKIEPFVITHVERSAHSGEFLYTGPKGVVMLEGLLFRSKRAARSEIARVARMFAAWTGAWEEAAGSPPVKD